MGFWEKLPRHFFCLAPLADVTDAAFRQIISKYSRHGEKDGGPDVFWTEFVSADGLASAQGREKLVIDLKYSENERPIVAQLFSSKPENMFKAAQLAKELGFDGIDINMGCPDRAIERQGTGAAHIKDPKVAQEVIRAAQEGAPGLPISVKTRTGYNVNQIETWVPLLLEMNIAALTIHARTRKEMSKVPAQWDTIKRAVEIRNESGKNTLIIGNGDVKDIADGIQKAEESGADGVMLGRAIFGNPWLFDRTRDIDSISLEEKLQVMVEHTKLFETLLGQYKNFSIMKKHYKAYVQGFEGARELRMKLMQSNSTQEVEEIVSNFKRE